jgi:hypothetical protein
MHAVTSLFAAVQRSRATGARTESQAHAQVKETPMTELSAHELRLVAGGPDSGPHGSWSSSGLKI